MIRTRPDIDPNFQLTDNDAILKALREVPREGAHSHDLRRFQFTGNVSQRVQELRDRGYEIRTEKEARGRRPGIRVWLVAEPSGAASAPPNPGRSLTPTGVAPEGALFEVPHVPQHAQNDELAA